MEWNDTLIVLNVHNYNDAIVIVSGLTNNYGVRSGSLKNSKATRNSIAIGNILAVSWRGRLENHLGHFKINSCESIYPFIYNINHKILAMMGACQLFYKGLPPKEPQKSLYAYLEDFLYALKYDDGQWLKRLLLLEMELLSGIGFGFDLNKCAVSGVVDNLSYLSPKTGRAVAELEGKPYANKLFRLPEIMKDINAETSTRDVIYSLKITRYFLDKYVEMPELRNNLELILQNEFSSLES